MAPTDLVPVNGDLVEVEAERAHEFERRLEQMGLDGDSIEQMGLGGDTGGLVDASEKLGALQAALRKVDATSEQIKTAGILRIGALAQLGEMDDLNEVAWPSLRATARAVAHVQKRGRLPELIAWAQANDSWGLMRIQRHIRPWGCGWVRPGCMKSAIEKSDLSFRQIAKLARTNHGTVSILAGKYSRGSASVTLELAERVGEVVGYKGSYPPASPTWSKTGNMQRARERRLYGENLPAAGDWRTVQDACLKIRSALNALDAVGQDIDGLWLRCDDLFRAAQEGQKGLRNPSNPVAA